MEDLQAILSAYLSQPNSITIYWAPDNTWQLVSATDTYINDAYYKNSLFDLYEIIDECDKPSFCKFVDSVKNKRLTEDTVPNRLEITVKLSTNIDVSLYYTISCSTNEQGGFLFKIHKLSSEDSYKHSLNKIVDNKQSAASFNDEIMAMMKQKPDSKFTIIQFDIENFKVINSQYGEKFGDDLLNHILNTLKFICTEDQLFARLNADVFMIIAEYTNKKDILKFIETIQANILGYKGVNYRIIYGINFIKENAESIRKYIDGAAMARQSIKGDALSYYAFYEDKMLTDTENETWVRMNMEHALVNNEFHMFLQPKYSISENRIIGAEALVRWIHPTLGIIPPVKFIPIFEQNGFVRKLDRYIWEEACKCLSHWRELGYDLIPISVNVSRKHLTDNKYFKFLESILKKYDVDKKYLELEITETYNELNVNENIKMLKDHGYILLMDDFGSGYSSLNTLKDTMFDVVKIDRDFLGNFIMSDRGKRIVEHTITMTKDIGLDVIAEGVETEEQAKFLASCGCDMAQGFLYAKPMPIDDFNNLLAESNK